MKQIILSFDYEIYFDGGNNYETLVSNTNKILSIARKNRTKLVFFIDVLYLIKLEEFGLKDAWTILKSQVDDISKQGHEIQFHFHPHWINVKYDDIENFWTFDKTEYSFSDISEKYGLDFAMKSFESAYEKFKDYFKVDSIAYRSGGLSINSHQKEMIELLIKNKFKFDSSVLPGLRYKGKYLNADHSNSPLKNHWKIDPSNGFFTESIGASAYVTEIPVMSLEKDKIKFANRIYTSIVYRMYNMFSNRRATNTESKPIDLNLTETYYPTSITFDKSANSDIVILKHFTREYFRLNNQIMCILSHPKSFLNQSFEVFEKYAKWLNLHKKAIKVSGFNDIN